MRADDFILAEVPLDISHGPHDPAVVIASEVVLRILLDPELLLEQVFVLDEFSPNNLH